VSYYPITFCDRAGMRSDLARARYFLGGGSGQVNGLSASFVEFPCACANRTHNQ
jgi:hypothetical protein